MLNVTNPENKLVFAIDGEGEYSIPYPKNLPLTYAKRLQALSVKDSDSRASAFMELFVDVLNQWAPGAADRLSVDAAAQVLKAWAGEEMGESSPRPTS